MRQGKDLLSEETHQLQGTSNQSLNCLSPEIPILDTEPQSRRGCHRHSRNPHRLNLFNFKGGLLHHLSLSLGGIIIGRSGISGAMLSLKIIRNSTLHSLSTAMFSIGLMLTMGGPIVPVASQINIDKEETTH